MMTKCSKIRLQVSVLRTNGPLVVNVSKPRHEENNNVVSEQV